MMTQLRNGSLNKLEESGYLLTQVKQTANDWILFRSNLSAFLSAARSITLVMQKEYHQTADFASWYKL
jgi:hypothetical protein